MNMKTASKGVDLAGLDALADFGNMSIGNLIGGGHSAPTPAPEGKPRLISLTEIDEDPHQPRHEFSDDSMQEMEDSIRERGVKTPVSVRPNPDMPGRWILNYGARRLRGSRRAGKTTIPAFVDEGHDDFDQVIENLQREDLTAMELARFIARKVEEGFKKGVIAKSLGKSAAFVSRHLDLVDLPETLSMAYDAGICREVEALYLLVTHYEQWSTEIDALIDQGDFLSKSAVKAFLSGLSTVAPPVLSDASDAATVAAASTSETSDVGEQSSDAGIAAQSPAPGGVPTQSPSGADAVTASKPADPGRIRKPIVQVFHNDQGQQYGARLLLDRRVDAGLAAIKYDHDGSEVVVDAGLLTISAVVEGA